jgi:hypothetical protein
VERELRMKNKVRRKDKSVRESEPDEFVELPGGTILARKGRFVVLETRRTPEEHKAFLARAREERKRLPAEISETVAELRKVLTELPMRETLSVLALPVFFVDPESYKEWQVDTPYIAVEYPTWLYLLQSENAVTAPKTLEPSKLETLRDLIKKAIDQTQFYFGLDLIKDGVSDAFGEIRFRTRIYNLSVRNPAYEHHLRKQLSSLLDPFETDLRNKRGFSLGDSLKILDAIERLENDRVARLRKELGSSITTPEELVRELGKRSSQIFQFRSSDIAQNSGLDSGLVERFLDFFSTSFEQPAIADSWPSTYEPLERAPLVKFSDGTWLAVLFAKLPWAIKTGFESVLLSDPTTKNRYERSRSRYLESRAVEMIASTSRHARKWTRLTYSFDDGDGTKQYELDGLVLVDRTAFLVEGKAGSMSFPARRGAESAKSELKELVAEAHIQSNRALRYLNSIREAEFVTEAGNKVLLRRSDLSRVYLVNVTLESLSAFATRLAGLRTAGILKQGELCWSVYELDLQVITEVVDGIGELVHYLDRRLAIEQMQVYAAEELDFFGHYLKEGLFLRDFFRGDSKTVLDLASYTEDLDSYYLYLTGARKTPALKPRQPISLLIRRLILALERNGPAGFVDAICILLEGNSKTRRMITKQVKDRRTRARKVGFAGFRLHLDNCSVLCYAAVAKISPRQIVDYVRTAKYQMRSNYAVGIVQNVANPNELQVSVERYPWKEDSSLDELAKTFSKNIHSKQF